MEHRARTSLDLATPHDVAQKLHTTTESLAQQRYKGTGIPFVKIGRRVLYRWRDVEEFIESHLMTRTDDRPGAA